MNRDDILAYATSIGERPHTAQQFETLLSDNQRLLTPSLLEELEGLSFLRARSGRLSCPSDLHFDTPTNRLTLDDEDQIVAGANEALYRRLGVLEHPSQDTLLGVIASGRERSEAPLRPDLLYPALVAALRRDRTPIATLAEEPILWVGSSYHVPNEVLVGTKIPSVFDQAMPVLRRADNLAQAYLSLGARRQPGEDHWTRLFEYVSETLGNMEAVSPRERRFIMEAYRERGSAGLPEDLDENACCLLDLKGRLLSLSDLKSGLLVENDYPILADALVAGGSTIGIADMTDRSRVFFSSLGIRPLTSLAGAGTPVFGAAAPPPTWFKQNQHDRLLTTLRRPIFSRALHELAVRQRHATLGFYPVALAEIRRRVELISGVDFFEEISREYRVGDHVSRVAVEVAVRDGLIGLVRPRTRLDFQQLVAQSLAELAGAANVAQARALSTAFLPLVLCRTAEDMRVYLERMGVDTRGSLNDQDDELGLEDEDGGDVGEEILRQVVQGLDTTRRDGEDIIASPVRPEDVTGPAHPPRATPVALPAPPFQLPDIGEVTLSIAVPSGQQIQGALPRVNRPGGPSVGWSPRTAFEVERDQKLGCRGEELVYLMEIESVRAMGHRNPSEFVIWTSQSDPGADHDIRSIDQRGRVRWIEVKSTSGTDGRFEWSRKEFEKALREGKSYELWRVYLAASANPIAKCFANPAALLGASKLVLELGTLRASIEDLS